MTSASFTEQEQAVIDLVSRACGQLNLETTAVDVFKLEGGTVPTLRFTLEGRVSTDLERGRIVAGGETPEALASVVVEELRKQMTGG
jgi:hypothetical protein